MTTKDFINLEQQGTMAVAVASPSAGIQQDATVYDVTETTYLAVTLTTNTVTNDEADTVTKKKKTILCVLSVAAACAAGSFHVGRTRIA